jgi:tetratricopeptide (TPR) repeat protein
MLGVAAVQQGRYAEAVLFLREADAVVGRADAAIQNNLAVALVRADAALADEALELIDAALEQQPGHPDLLATRGEVCVALGMWLEAVECLTAALPARRGDAELQRLLEKATLSLRDQQRSDRLKRPGLRPREPAQPRQQPGTAGFGSDVPDRE